MVIAGDTKHLQTLMKSETPKVIPLMIKGYGRASMLPMVFSRKDNLCFCGQHATHAKSYFIMQKSMGLKSVTQNLIADQLVMTISHHDNDIWGIAQQKTFQG